MPKHSLQLTIDTISGGNGEGVPPVPFPNTEVKPFSVDGTWLVTARESRTSPDSNKHFVAIQGVLFLPYKQGKTEFPTKKATANQHPIRQKNSTAKFVQFAVLFF